MKERVTEDEVNLNSFKPKNFESAALSKSSAKLTWDETDPERIKAERDAFLPDADLDQLQYVYDLIFMHFSVIQIGPFVH